MPLQETLDTFQYYISEIDKLEIAYITIVRYSPYFDVEIDGEWQEVLVWDVSLENLSIL